MKFTKSYIACDPGATQRPEVAEIEECIEAISWGLIAQGDYNTEFKKQFTMRGWKPPRSSLGRKRSDFGKNGVIVEVQFGNIGVIFNDLLKFNYDHVNGDLQLGVFITPVNPKQFLPDTRKNINGMTSFHLVDEYFGKAAGLFIRPAPLLLIGLLSENEDDYILEMDDDLRPLRRMRLAERDNSRVPSPAQT